MGNTSTRPPPRKDANDKINDTIKGLMAPGVQYFNDEFRNPGKTHRPPRLSEDDYIEIGYIARGGFGRVSRCLHTSSKKQIAVKYQSKAFIVGHDLVGQVQFERDVMYAMDSDFIAKLLYAGSTERGILMAFEYAHCGSFYDVLWRNSADMTEEAGRFFLAQMVLMLEYLESVNITHCDWKPENILVDENGYLKLTDFGAAQLIRDEKSYRLRGTPEYMAPEMLLNHGYIRSVDVWSYGVIAYRTIFDRLPLISRRTSEVFQMIRNHKIDFTVGRMNLSDTVRRFIRALLRRKVENRLGCRAAGVREIREHRFFDGLDWVELFHRRTCCPIAVSPRREPYDGEPLESPDVVCDGLLSDF